MLGIMFLIVACLLGLTVFKLGHDAGWHWAGSFFAALIPVAFAFFLGMIGLLIAGLFVGAVWKATG